MRTQIAIAILIVMCAMHPQGDDPPNSGKHYNPDTQQEQQGHTLQTGKVEVFDNNRWGGVCHSQFTTAEKKDNFAKATCRTLGQLQGEWMTPRDEKGLIAQKSMNCQAGVGETLEKCDVDMGWQVVWFQKTNGKGSPKDSSGNEQSMWALKQSAPQNNLYRALKDCLMMPGCFSIGQVVNDNSATLTYRSRKNSNGLSHQTDAAGFKANIDALRYSAGYCDKPNVSFDGFNNRMCDGGRQRNIGFRQTLVIKDTESKTWHFSPRVDFGLGGAVFIDNTLKVKSETDMWQPNDDKPGLLDFSHKIVGTQTIQIYGAEDCCDGQQRLLYSRDDSATPPAVNGNVNMYKNGWRLATDTNISKDIKDISTSKDVYYFFVDKANGQTAADSFSKQMPFYAVEEVSRKTNAGTGPSSATPSEGNGVKQLQTWTMIDHKDRNMVTAKEFGYFLDGSPVSNDFFGGVKAGDKHFVYEDKNGKWKTTAETTKFGCATCEMTNGDQRVMKGPQNFWGAVKACQNIGGDLPKKLAAADKSNASYSLKGCKGDIQSPQSLRRENFWRQSSLECHQAVVQCVGNHTCPGCVSEPEGFGRLIDTQGKVVVSYLPNEGFLTSENFIVSSSPGVELGRWDNLNADKKVKGFYVQFRPDEGLSFAGPESTYTLTWHQEELNTDVTPNTQVVKDFSNSDLSKNTAGYSGAYNVAGRGSYWIWFPQDYFQKSKYGCKEVLDTSDEDEKICPSRTLKDGTKRPGIEHFRCVFFAKMFLPPLSGVRWSFTWVYMVTQNTCQSIGPGEFVSDSMQCPRFPCPDSTSVTGINIKAAEFANCSFRNPNEKPEDKPPKALNPDTLKAGTDVKIRCQWDTNMLKYGAITKWEQGMNEADSPNSQTQADIRANGYKNNTHIKVYPYSCLAGMGRQSKEKDHEDQENLATKGWKQIILTCDQQFNGFNAYHKLSMTFVLNKNITRRRRLPAGDGDTKGDEGTFAYNMRSGKCVEDDSGTACDGKKEEKEDKGEFALWFSLLALFALY